MTPDQIDETIFDLVQRRQHVSFVEIQTRARKAGIPADGTWAMTLDGYEYIILWEGLSDELYCALKRLIEGRRLWLHLAAPLTYYIDGVVPSLPTCKSPSVTRDSWLPVVLCTFPHQAARQAESA